MNWIEEPEEEITPQPISRATPLKELPDLLTPQEVQQFLGLGKTAVYRLINEGELEHIKIGRRKWVFKETFQPQGDE